MGRREPWALYFKKVHHGVRIGYSLLRFIYYILKENKLQVIWSLSDIMRYFDFINLTIYLLKKAYKIHDDWRVLYDIAVLEFLYRKTAIESAKKLEKCVEPSEKDCDVLFWLASIYIEIGEVDKGESILDSILVDSKNSDILVKKGLLSENGRRYDDALMCYLKTISVDPNNYFGLTSIARIMQRQGRYNESIIYIDRALRIWNKGPEANYLKGQFLLTNKIIGSLNYLKIAKRSYNMEPELLLAFAKWEQVFGSNNKSIYYAKQVVNSKADGELVHKANEIIGEIGE